MRFADLAALQAAPAGSLAGKIAFIDYRMERATRRQRLRHGLARSAAAVRRRRSAPARSAYLMRSAGTDSHRNPHTGITRFDDGLTPIPVGRAGRRRMPTSSRACSRAAAGARASVALDCGWDGDGDLAQRDRRDHAARSKPDEVVLIGGHLDSWDLGTGAIDDGAGVGHRPWPPGKLIGDMKQRPARTIRVVAFANEEQGLYGGKRLCAAARGRRRASTRSRAESDFGAGRIYAFSSGVRRSVRRPR